MKTCTPRILLLIKKFCFPVVFVFFILIHLVLYADENVLLIANNDTTLDTLTQTDVMNIFLGKKTTWDTGNKITFVTLKEGPTHHKFITTYVKRNPTQFKNHWKQMLFTGKGVIPKSFESDKDMIDYVSKNKNAVGYVSSVAPTDNVKVIAITQ